MPKSCSRSVAAVQYGFVLESNHDTGCIECNRAASVAKWTKSEQRVGAEVRNNVNLAGFRRQSWEI